MSTRFTGRDVLHVCYSPLKSLKRKVVISEELLRGEKIGSLDMMPLLGKHLKQSLELASLGLDLWR